jgi:hypothetical protein
MLETLTVASVAYDPKVVGIWEGQWPSRSVVYLSYEGAGRRALAGRIGIAQTPTRPPSRTTGVRGRPPARPDLEGGEIVAHRRDPCRSGARLGVTAAAATPGPLPPGGWSRTRLPVAAFGTDSGTATPERAVDVWAVQRRGRAPAVASFWVGSVNNGPGRAGIHLVVTALPPHVHGARQLPPRTRRALQDERCRTKTHPRRRGSRNGSPRTRRPARPRRRCGRG